MGDSIPFDDAVDLLDADHRLVKTMFLEYEALCDEKASDAVRQTLAERICRAVQVHARIDAEIFYPALRIATEDDDLIEDALAQHEEEKVLIGHIRGLAPSSGDYDATVKGLGDAVEEHVRDERKEIFVEARSGALDLHALAGRLALRKKTLEAALAVTALPIVESAATARAPLSSARAARGRSRRAGASAPASRRTHRRSPSAAGRR